MLKKLLIISLIGVALTNAQTPKIQNSLQNTLERNGKANVIIRFKQETQPILVQVNNKRFDSRGNKISFLKTQLEQLARDSQTEVISILLSSKSVIHFESFWINNKIFVKNASQELIQKIAEIPNVTEIREELVAHINRNQERAYPANTKQDEVQWGVGRIEADQAWELVGGNHGEGIVVANIDTGVRRTHEALRDNYRTTYGWYDAFARVPNPLDIDGDGTHSMGIIAGTRNGIGVAPGVQWIACKACEYAYCDEVDLLKCGEWILCPTTWNGQRPDCSMAPNLVSNGWAVDKGNDFYAEVIGAWHAANIIPIFEVGDGPNNCETVQSPGDYSNVITVGSFDPSNTLKSNSGRGPTMDGRIKPDLTAPGHEIISAGYEGDYEYETLYGYSTSTACPHVAGTVALLLARNPDLTFDQIKDLLQDNADREVGSTLVCGGTNYTTWPNNMYGHGRVNARRALASLIGGFTSVAPEI
ncbi:Bacillopeptidase F [Orchesella cincta]|uniref:Bacillopeptidase F n=1 Tax=Orchesella cincta TaxID=48709 RepID=A0A1D2MGD5_ORCCI|nr:Bacillopeptidase F [Orchesella cincta]